MRSLIIRWMGSFGLLGYGWVGDGLKVGARQQVGGLGGSYVHMLRRSGPHQTGRCKSWAAC